MIRVMMICYGNICRSPMAEFLIRDMVEKRGAGDKFYIASAATSTEEIGNGVHYGARKKLAEHGISPDGKRAVQLRRSDANKYDYFIGMDTQNIRAIERILGNSAKGRIFRLLDFSDRPRDIADPWYTHNFDVTYDDIIEGCEAFLARLSI